MAKRISLAEKPKPKEEIDRAEKPEMLGMEVFDTGDLVIPRYKIVQPTSKEGTPGLFRNNLTNEEKDRINVVVLAATKGRVCWSENIEEDPVCRSSDGLNPSGDVEKPVNQVCGTKENGKRFEPVHHRLATHWARLIEMLYAAERMMELATDPEITSPDVRRIPERVAGYGVGSVEAPRGTLIHQYRSDDKGILTAVNLIVGTTNNHAAMAMSIKRAAEKLIHAGRAVEETLLNRIEMAFRLYDPCLSCATHTLPGQMPIVARIRAQLRGDNSGNGSSCASLNGFEWCYQKL